jgi:hypothetical protein
MKTAIADLDCTIPAPRGTIDLFDISMMLHPKYNHEVLGQRCAVLFQPAQGGGEERFHGTVGGFQYRSWLDEITHQLLTEWHHTIDFDDGDTLDLHLETLELQSEFWWLDENEQPLGPTAISGARARPGPPNGSSAPPVAAAAAVVEAVVSVSILQLEMDTKRIPCHFF